MSYTRVEKVEINSINAPANNTYGFHQGFPIVQFEIAAQNKMLVGTSVRLNGEFSILQNVVGSATIGTLVNNNSARFGGIGAAAPAVFSACANNRVGVASTIQQITLSNQENNQSLEICRQYPRYLATVMPVTHSGLDFDSNVQQQSGTASRNSVSAAGMNEVTSFSMPLRTGLLSGTAPLPLSQLGGLNIEILLSPDANAIGPNISVAGVETSTGATYYRLQNLTLSYDLLVPDEDLEAQMTNVSDGAISYNSINHIYSTINSSDQSLVLNLGSQKVLSVFSNFIPTPHINDFTKDSNGTPFLANKGAAGLYDATADVTEIAFSKGGVNFPIDTPIVATTGGGGFRPEVEYLSNLMDSIKPFRHTNHTLVQLQTQCGLAIGAGEIGYDSYVNPATLPDHRPVAGLGIRTDPFKVGIDYSRQPYGLRIRSTLDGESPNSIFTYTLSENTLMYSPNGIRVLN
jgi:hypothetical protein